MRFIYFCVPFFFTLSRVVAAFALVLRWPISEGMCLAIGVISDVLDGYTARLFGVQSRFGTYFDPIADKLFALSFVYHFYESAALLPYQLIALFSRDISLCLFWMYLFLSSRLHLWRVRAFFLGKMTTSLQFFAFFFLVIRQEVPESIWILLYIVGIGAFFELLFRLHSTRSRDTDTEK